MCEVLGGSYGWGGTRVSVGAIQVGGTGLRWGVGVGGTHVVSRNRNVSERRSEGCVCVCVGLVCSGQRGGRGSGEVDAYKGGITLL